MCLTEYRGGAPGGSRDAGQEFRWFDVPIHAEFEADKRYELVFSDLSIESVPILVGN